jgi:hypothetical protein
MKKIATMECSLKNYDGTLYLIEVMRKKLLGELTIFPWSEVTKCIGVNRQIPKLDGR